MRGGMTVFTLNQARGFCGFSFPIVRMMAAGNPHDSPQHGACDSQPGSN
jgi:hypothetical protein